MSLIRASRHGCFIPLARCSLTLDLPLLIITVEETKKLSSSPDPPCIT